MQAREMAESVKGRLSGQEAADYLGLSLSTLEKMRHTGRGPRFLRLGKRVQYRKVDLDAYVDSRVVETSDSRAAA